MSFYPSANEPQTMDSEALCFCFFEGDLLLLGPEDAPRIPKAAEWLLLGLTETHRHYLGHSERYGYCYAFRLEEKISLDDSSEWQWMPLKPVGLLLGEDLFKIAGRAIQILRWAETHRHCGVCGSLTEASKEEFAMICPQCGEAFYPRLAPAVIMRIEREGRILLARNQSFPQGFYSVLAGFVEPGESLEEAVSREVREEVGLEIEAIRYFGSQPWPFPNSLMIGFTARYKSGEIQIQETELTEADWYLPDEIPSRPPSLSISGRLIQDFVESENSKIGSSHRS